MHALQWLFGAELHIGGQAILWREVVGNLIGIISAVLGMRRSVWTWPVGVVGNVLLFTVFFGIAFSTPEGTTLFGQAGRQVFFIVVSGYGWWRWAANRRRASAAPAVRPRWATPTERAVAAIVGVVAIVGFAGLFALIGEGWPAPTWYYFADAWIFVGSMLATYAMARGWVEFWLCWIGVDLVGVPVLVYSHFYPSATLYAVYAGFVVWGFVVWLRISRREQAPAPEPAGSTVAGVAG